MKDSHDSERKVPDIPIVVDLDGTLLHTDMLHESALSFIRFNFFRAFLAPLWLIRGKAFFKRKMAEHFEFDEKSLPYNKTLVEWLQDQKALGRTIILSTASDKIIADKIANFLAFFDVVIGSDGYENNGGEVKATKLVEAYGLKGFDYVGNSHSDLKVWKSARYAIITNASRFLQARAEKISKVIKIFPKKAINLLTWMQVLRVHQWSKNTLLIVPLLASHRFDNPLLIHALFFAFLSFSLCASSIYIINDLLDLENDRQHPRKSARPFAAGQLPILYGIIAAPILLGGGFFIAQMIDFGFLICLIIYTLITLAYSWKLKSLILVDCLCLAILYTLRVIAGSVATGIDLSFFLLAFSVFLFFSLAFVKRYAELHLHNLRGKERMHGRGYLTTDAPMIQMLGISSGFTAVLILVFYLNSENITKLYRVPEVIWLSVPLMMLWVSWVWIKAHRGEMHDDPIIFAFKDKASILIGVLFVMVFAVAEVR